MGALVNFVAHYVIILAIFVTKSYTKTMKEPQESVHQGDHNFIDVERVFSQKNPRLSALIPGFVYAYLKRILHQNQINNFISKSKHRHGLDFVDAVMEEFDPEVELIGLDNIPLSERIIIASNHPLGGLDGIALMQAVGKKRHDIRFPVNDILLYFDNLKPLFIPINKHGSNAENIRILNETFEGNDSICYFPFGLVSRKKNGHIYDLEWKKTFLTKAKRYKRTIVPTHIAGRNSNFFYNFSNIRKSLGIKANIEMLYLADEFFKQKNKKIVITFGTPISYDIFDKKRSDKEWATQLRNYIYQLPKNPDLVFDPTQNYTLF